MATDACSVLKLVHPGGHVEIHYSPVRTSDVMDRNPRHFVTRPDVFKFPWIVVRPESVLNPGSVFYIVPCHTLYRLLHESQTSQPMVSTVPDKLGRWKKVSEALLEKTATGIPSRKAATWHFCLPEDRDDEERKALLMAD